MYRPGDFPGARRPATEKQDTQKNQKTVNSRCPGFRVYAMEEAGLFIADQMAAWISHAPMITLDPAVWNPQIVVSFCRRFSANRGCPG